MRLFLLAIILLVSTAALPVIAESPLETVMDGRAAAATSNLTEAAIRGTDDAPGLAQKAANIVMYVCGALAIALTAAGMYQLYQAADGDRSHGATKEGAMWKLVIAGLLSIPAIIAAILPYAIL